MSRVAKQSTSFFYFNTKFVIAKLYSLSYITLRKKNFNTKFVIAKSFQLLILLNLLQDFNTKFVIAKFSKLNLKNTLLKISIQNLL